MTDGHEAFSARDLTYMAMALEEARGAAEAGDVPVGAVLVRATPSGDAVLAIGRNTRERDHTALGHAEINAIGDACRACGAWRLADCTLYVTLEPCPMCAGAILGARAAYIGGCAGTACTISDQLYGVYAGGTMAHSWVQMFDSQYEAFKAYCEIYPDNPTLLVDTYNTLKSGVPDAIRAFNEVLKPRGLTKCGIRLDSGDMTYLTKKARKMLDEAGWESCKISVSNALDEYLIQDLLNQGACIDMFGVGERLITARSEPVFGGVYKLTAVEDADGNILPKIKISENVGKITNPHFKKLYRFFGNDTGKAIADYLCVYDETVDDSKDLEIFDPSATWKRKTVYDFTAKELMVQVFRNGELVYDLPPLKDIQKYCAEQVDTLWDEVKRFDNPHTYYVDLSQKLWDIKNDLLNNKGK